VVMEVDGRWLPLEINETSSKHQQPSATLDGDIGNFELESIKPASRPRLNNSDYGEIV
jgi:hypothetical protein